MSAVQAAPTGYDALRAVILNAIDNCPDAERGELRQRFVQFAAGLEPDDLATFEQVIADIDAERAASDENYQASVVPWRQNPALMAHHLEGDAFTLYPHVALLGEKFRQLDSGEDRFQIWNLPPQYFKSTIAQRGVAWAIDKNPSDSYITTSYGDDLADRNGIAIRDYLIEHGEQLRVRLKRDQKRADRFVTESGGGLLAAGLFSGMTGFGASGGIVIDDPFKGWEDAHSAAHRLKVINTIKSVVFARRSGARCWILVIMTRWHEADTTAELVELAGNIGMTFTVTRLPEIAEAPDRESTNPILRLPDPLGRAPGELLCPDLFGPEDVRLKQAFFGEYLAAGLLQQRPAPAAGTEIMREWFRIEDTLPPKPTKAIASWDMKLKDKEAGDFVVGQCWWKVGGDYWCLDQLRGKWNQATTENAMALMAIRHPEIKLHYFENTGNGPEVANALREAKDAYVVSDAVAGALGMTERERELVQEMRRRGMESLVPVTPIGDKSIRMRSHSGRLEGGNVHLPRGASWVPGYLDEMAAFPNGGHDDQVDATSQALTKLAGAAVVVGKTPQGAVPTTKSATPGAPARIVGRRSAVPGR